MDPSYVSLVKTAPDDMPTPAAPKLSYFTADGSQATDSPGTPTPPAGRLCSIDSSRVIGISAVMDKVISVTSSNMPEINIDDGNIFIISSQSENIDSFSTNLTGTPYDGQVIQIRITGPDPVEIGWGPSFLPTSLSLPDVTVGEETLSAVFQFYANKDAFVIKSWDSV